VAARDDALMLNQRSESVIGLFTRAAPTYGSVGPPHFTYFRGDWSILSELMLAIACWTSPQERAQSSLRRPNAPAAASNWSGLISRPPCFGSAVVRRANAE